MLRLALISLLMTLTAYSAKAEEPQRDTLWLTTTVRAAPGDLKGLIKDFQSLERTGYYERIKRSPPLILRHSQGDQWDLMLLEPIGSYSAFFDPNRLALEANLGALAEAVRQLDDHIAYRDQLFAYGPSADIVNAHAQGMSFFHIEMFDALPGLKPRLIEQREMENVYIEATNGRGNLIFEGDMGTNVDVFTIGAYSDIVAFAAPSGATEEDREKAAIDAGFEDGSSIGFYLRSLISAHHDTLANRVN